MAEQAKVTFYEDGTRVVCYQGSWYWIPMDVTIPGRIRSVGPFSTEQEAKQAGIDNGWSDAN